MSLIVKDEYNFAGLARKAGGLDLCWVKYTRFLGKFFLILCAVSGLCLLNPGPLQARELPACFQEADAINNYIHKRYQVAPDGSYELEVELQAEIRTYKGKKERADFRFPYNSAFQSVQVKRARTILPSGKVLKVGKKEIQDILDPSTARSSLYSRSRLKVVNFPGVEIGSKIELTLTVNSTLGFWTKESFRLSDPTLVKTVEIQVPFGGVHNGQAGPKSKGPGIEGHSSQSPVQALSSLVHSLHDPLVHFKRTLRADSIIYSWSGEFLPKEYSEPGSPRLENQPFCLLVSSFRSWSAVAEFYQARFHKAIEKTGLNLPQWARGASPDQLYEQLLERLAVYPIALFKTDLVPQDPDLTLAKGYGSSLDLAVLFYALLQRQGRGADLLLANNQGVFVRPLTKSFFPALFNQVLVMTSGQIYFFADKNLPPGVTYSQGGQGLSLAAGKLQDLPVRMVNQSRTSLALSLTRQALQGKCEQIFCGQSTLQIRKNMRHVLGRELEIQVSDLVHQLDPVARLRGRFHALGLERLEEPVILNFAFDLQSPFLTSGEDLFFPLPGSKLLAGLSTYVRQRHYGLVFPKTRKESLKMTIVLSEDLNKVSGPQDSQGRLGPLSWRIISRCQAGKLIFIRELTLKRSLVSVNQSTDLLAKIVELNSPRQRLLVFR